MKEGDSIGVIQGVNESLQTSLAAAILKGMDVLHCVHFLIQNMKKEA